jgi:hypothetical protein
MRRDEERAGFTNFGADTRSVTEPHARAWSYTGADSCAQPDSSTESFADTDCAGLCGAALTARGSCDRGEP